MLELDPTGRRGAGSADDGAPLDFAQSAPYAMWFSDAQGIVEALFAHRASGADRFRLSFSSGARLFALKMGWREKDSRRVPAAGGAGLPVFGCMERCHLYCLNAEVTPENGA
jgi:hypothetical protein